MPAIELDNLFQTAVLWRKSGANEFNEPTLYYPVEINVRWEEARKDAVDDKGNPISYDATVFVDQEIPMGSFMWLGNLEDAYPTAPTSGLFEVIMHDDVPDIKGRIHQRTVMLKRFNGTLPTIEPGTGTGSGTG